MLRGEWRAILNQPSSDEGEATFLFIGVSNQPLIEDFEDESDELQVSAVGRLVVVLRRAAEYDELPTPESVLDLIGQGDELEIRRGGEVLAQGTSLPGGRFRVFRWSISRESLGSARESDRILRNELLSGGSLIAQALWRHPEQLAHFAQRDVDFRSPSAAARLVLGTMAGRREWIMPDGTPMGGGRA